MPPNTTTTELLAYYTATNYRSPDGAFAVISGRTEKREAVSLKGPADGGPTLTQGVLYKFVGKWEEHEKYGEQFAFAAWFPQEPDSERGVLAYLTSVADNIGPKRAQRLWDRYGPLAISTLRTNPEAVAEAGILSLAEAKEASQSLHDAGGQEAVKVALMGLLSGRGFQMARVMKELIALYGARAAERLRRNPYLLLVRKLPSCGWKRVDRLYLDLGYPPDRLKRQALVVVAELRNNRDGDTWVAAAKIDRALRAAVPGARVDARRAMLLGRRAGLIVTRRDPENTVWVAEAGKAENEQAVNFHVRRLLGWIPERLTRFVARRRTTGRRVNTSDRG